LLSASRPHTRSSTSAAGSKPGALERATQHNTNRHDSRSEGSAMEFVDRADARLEPIPLERCRELLGEEAETLTDEEVALIRCHAEMMAYMVVEMYLEDRGTCQ
jgi:hypothetical protein